MHNDTAHTETANIEQNHEPLLQEHSEEKSQNDIKNNISEKHENINLKELAIKYSERVLKAMGSKE